MRSQRCGVGAAVASSWNGHTTLVLFDAMRDHANQSETFESDKNTDESTLHGKEKWGELLPTPLQLPWRQSAIMRRCRAA